MARKKQLLTQEEIEYRRMAKQANQRTVRLERFLADNKEAPTAGLDLYNYYLLSDYGGTRRRFPEDPKKLSSEQLQVYSVQLSNFLSTDLSQVGAAKKYQKLYEKYKKDITNRPPAPIPTEPEDKKLANRIAGIEGKELKDGMKITNSREFFDAVNAMFHYKFQKMMSYKDIMRIIASVQNRSKEDVMTEIARIADEMAQNRKVTYREIQYRMNAIQIQKR